MDTLLKRVPKNLAITCTLNHRIRRQTRWLSVIVFRLIRSGSCPNCWHKIAKCGLLYYTAYTVPMMRSYPWHCLSWATWVVSRTGLGMASIAVLNGAPALYPGVLISVAILRRVSARNMPVAQTVYSGSKNVANGLIIRQNPLQEWLYSLTGISKEILGRKMVAQIILVSLRGWRMV